MDEHLLDEATLEEILRDIETKLDYDENCGELDDYQFGGFNNKLFNNTIIYQKNVVIKHKD